MKFLCLHGYQQSAAIMQSETWFLKDIFEKSIGKEVEFFYPSALFPSDPTASNEPTYSWWTNDATVAEFETFRYLSDILDQEGPFEGIVGFSQGGSVGSLIAALLERPKAARPSNFTTCHGPLRLVVSYSGYHEDDARLQKYYAQKIKTPILHFISSTDPVMAEERCFRLVRRCEDSDDRVVVYPGSGFHRVPATKIAAQALSRFLTEVLDIEDEF
ncbi:putative Serine hydrolase FSH domain-containing protein [Seiridium cardinale]|uniref:Serine hydrolase FSH domain-containing protein n=1 Tax=Seiridium cardinale TaxID=138064 RepID=A0ABR2XJX5_9PEZI